MGEYCNQDVTNKVWDTLKIWNLDVWSKNGNFATGIVRNYYYACMKNTGNASDNTPCYFLYFWIGAKLNENLKDGQQLQRVMNSIYDKLKNFQFKYKNSNKCNNIYPHMNTYLFEHAKNLFDWKYNYDALKKRAQRGECSCIEKYTAQLESAKSTYGTVSSICENGGPDEYCTKFNSVRNQWNPQNLPKLECKEPSAGDDFDRGDAVVDGADDEQQPSKTKPKPNPNQAGSSGSFSDADLTDGVSGGEGKGGSDGGVSYRIEGEEARYTTLFSWIKNFFGRNRKRESVLHELNASSDGTSIDYTRSNLTGTDYMTEYSIPYTSSFR
ncbi:hypothetical protein PCYB_002090 [Plasmodium cynomolgi strain B]|uniref:CYIR protein n=1 Tax=Plasmodium cynomolgi (strain B) TaxID=1120755 RepID=K6V2H2_PLACD|nr:hypothetical protein PCYB_002090 [Plasmodium cynomolgi strain B]GAB69460.1 hypothetical protein PCYB_002090 [Plasmodium cynomolgi strain B]